MSVCPIFVSLTRYVYAVCLSVYGYILPIVKYPLSFSLYVDGLQVFKIINSFSEGRYKIHKLALLTRFQVDPLNIDIEGKN